MTPLPDYMRRIRKANARAYYLTKDRKIYRDRVAEFVCDANTRSNGAVIRRLERIYPRLLIDEVQDLCGYDLELLDQLFCSRIRVVAVGDLRQANLRTNLGRKNRRYRGAGLLDWLQERTEYIAVEERTCSYRSNQAICDFADRLFSTLPRTTSANTHVTGHDGVFLVPRSVVHAYASRFRPMVLRHDRTVDTLGLHAQNIGVSKGKTYERVLIFPTKMVQEYLRTGDIRRAGDKTNLYVAVTRAQYSVAFVVDDADVDPMEHAGLAIRWQP